MFLLKHWKLVLIGLAIVTIGGLVLHYRHLIEQNAAYKAVIATANNTISALNDLFTKHEENYEKEREANEEIDAAPQSDDAPVAPVLRRTLERL